MSQSEQIELPDFVTKKIEEISSRTEISPQEITKDYLDLFQDPFIQEDQSFKTDHDRHSYASMVLWTRYISRPPVKDFEIITAGVSPIRATKKTGSLQSAMFVFAKGDSKLKRLVFSGDVARHVNDITLLAKYTNVKLGQFKDGGDLIADPRSKFEDPIAVNLDTERIIGLVKAKRINIKDAPKFPSKVGSDGYVDHTDWRVIRGIIIRGNSGKDEKTGGEWGVYTISDQTVDDEPKVGPDGKVMRPGFTIWVSPRLMSWRDESECDFLGTVQIGQKNKEPSMNCYLILPVHAQVIPTSEEKA